ncbi:MAG: ABC transporter permease [Clostridiaceae bacterium]|nr:ABC transporter permease [Clostridiaceae bacterium]
MSKTFFYLKLAVNNLKKNSKAYVPYIITCIGTIIMFYNMCFLASAKTLGLISDDGSLKMILTFGTVVIGIFSAIFLFYTNSFLVKKRKKEFGLFNILGMEKKHIAKIMFWETVLTGAISLSAGLAGGILLSKAMILLLFKIIAIRVTFGFEVPTLAVVITPVLFGAIFAINFIYNSLTVRLSKPVELLKGGNVGEKEPKTKLFQGIVGLLSLSAGYYIALFTESPLQALTLFFIAVILVMIGTYCLFTSGSIAVLKLLRKNKNYYYKPKNFISVSSMIYRMKRNAAGLANICILSTAVIVMLSSTVSLYIGVEDVLRTRYPRDITVGSSFISDENVEKMNKIIEDTTDSLGIERRNVLNYRYLTVVAFQEDSRFQLQGDSLRFKDSAALFFMDIDGYNKMYNANKTLEENEVLLYEYRGRLPGDSMTIEDLQLRIKERVPAFEGDGNTSAMMINSFYLVARKDDLQKIIRVSDPDNTKGKDLAYFYGFDVNADKQTQIQLATEIRKGLKELGISYYADGADLSRESFYTLYGGLFYLGIFLGLLFIMATDLINNYKQIAEGYDDKERYEIMQKVGMSREEVRKSINSQVIKVFFLPLLAAVIHIAFAFKVITKLLEIFNLTNVPLFALCTLSTILIFSVFYVAVYTLTAKTYYKIVKG